LLKEAQYIKQMKLKMNLD